MKTLYIAGEGGHSARIVAILEAGLFPGEADKVHVAITHPKEAAWFKPFAPAGNIHLITKPNPLNYGRARQLPRWIKAAAQSLALLVRVRPNLVVAGGANAALVPCALAGLFRVRVVVAESFVQVQKPGRACRLLDRLRIASEVLTEWPFQGSWFRNARYVGLLVPRQGASGLRDGDTTYPCMKLMKAVTEGKRVRAATDPAFPAPLRATHEKFIRFLREYGWIDGDGWVQPSFRRDVKALAA